jgi:hypothetical protein
MFQPDQPSDVVAIAMIEPTPRGACLVTGCPCKDARIVSHRRAAFFAAIARQNGETADRQIAADPAWPIAA